RRRLWLRLRGFGFKRRDETQIPKNELTRVDVCWTMAAVLSTTDTIRGAELQTRAMLMALQAGEPVRIAKALAAEAGYTATGGGKSRKRTDKLRESAYALAREVEHPLAIALATVADGLGAILEGRWRYGLETCDKAETLFREHYVGVAWEVPSIQFFTIWALAYLGELPEMARRVARGLREGQERGGLHVDTNLRIGRPNLAWLVADDAVGARAAVEAAMAQWPQQGFHLQHYYALFAMTNADLYSGGLEKTKARMEKRWPALAKSLCLRIQLTRLEALHTRGRMALATGDAEAAERDARAIARENMPWANPLALLLRAGAAARRKNADAAVALARQAAAGFDGADMALYAAAARWRAGDSGAAEAWMRERKVVRPDRMVALLAPGWGQDPGS